MAQFTPHYVGTDPQNEVALPNDGDTYIILKTKGSPDAAIRAGRGAVALHAGLADGRLTGAELASVLSVVMPPGQGDIQKIINMLPQLIPEKGGKFDFRRALAVALFAF